MSKFRVKSGDYFYTLHIGTDLNTYTINAEQTSSAQNILTMTFEEGTNVVDVSISNLSHRAQVLREEGRLGIGITRRDKHPNAFMYRYHYSGRPRIAQAMFHPGWRCDRTTYQEVSNDTTNVSFALDEISIPRSLYNFISWNEEQQKGYTAIFFEFKPILFDTYTGRKLKCSCNTTAYYLIDYDEIWHEEP